MDRLSIGQCMVLDLYMCIVQPTTYFNLGTTKVFSNMFCAFWYGISFTSAGFAILLPLLSTKEYTVLYIFWKTMGLAVMADVIQFLIFG